MPIVNPDGYDYTFVTPGTRMWRKNLRDNNGDGAITVGDGVDTNRNWPTMWRFDPEGASDNPVSETYRGTAPASEPEVAAYRALQQQIDAEFMIDFHSYGELILYPEGWQVETQATDNPILEALAAATSCVPAIPGYDPDLSAELYTVNGDITDDALHRNGTQAYTVELDPRLGRAGGRYRRPAPEPDPRGRVPGLRGRRAAGVRGEPRVRARPGEVRGRPGRSGLAHRQRGAGVRPERSTPRTVTRSLSR